MVDPAQRLAAAPGIQRVPTRELDLFILRGFLDAEACAGLIRRIDEKRRPSDIADDVGIADFRTSETCDLDWRDPVVAAVDSRIANLLGLSLEDSEPLQGQRYAPGQEFKPHTDTFEPGGYERVVFRGDPASREFVAFWTAGGQVLAGMNVNVWDVSDDIQTVVRAGWAGATVDPARLTDPDVPLAELAR